MERALWSAHWACAWSRAVRSSLVALGEARAAARGGAAGDDMLFPVRAELSAAADYIHHARELLLPCMEYTAISDVR